MTVPLTTKFTTNYYYQCPHRFPTDPNKQLVLTHLHWALHICDAWNTDNGQLSHQCDARSELAL